MAGMRSARVRTFATGLTFAAMAACGGSGAAPPPASTTSVRALERCEPRGVLDVGERIPLDCSFERLDGEILTLRELVGRPAIINFWASWCTYCVREMPDFERARRVLGDKLEMVGMDLLDVQGETRAAAQRFARQTGVRYPLAYDPGGLLYAAFSITSVMPLTVLVDARGVLVHRQFGPVDDERLLDLVREKLDVAA